MFRAKKYRNRHIVLKTLEEHYRTTYIESTDWIEYGLFFEDLVSKSKLSELEVNEQLQCLINEKEVVDEELRHLDILYIISPAGRSTFYDKKYLDIGKREFLNNSYDVLKNISAVILLIIAITTFITNFIDTRKNKAEIESLRNEISKLKSEKNYKQAQQVTGVKSNR
jgi:hypothetical protein